MRWVATTEGYTSNDVRDLVLAAVEHRFENVDVAPTSIGWPSDNGSAYIAYEMRAFVNAVGLTPLTTPVCSPQSNGMAEGFVKTMKSDYVAFMLKPEATAAVQNLALSIEHYDEKHPHSAPEYRSPRDFQRRTEPSIFDVMRCPEIWGILRTVSGPKCIPRQFDDLAALPV